MPLAPAARALGALAVLVLVMFADVLFAPGWRVLGHPGTDLALQFIPWRDFGFAELAKGNLPLWNPHIFAGAPFFGGMQSALLYPVNWLFLVLPLPLAINWTIALNLWLLGAFMILWALRRGLHPLAAFLSATLACFGAPYFLHIHAGHLTNLAAMAWMPLIFLALDEWLRLREMRWCLLGMLAVAMQLFAGHPQYVYLTGIAAALYFAIRLAEPANRSIGCAAGFPAVYAGGALLAAVQLFSALQVASETVRSETLGHAFAAMFAFPPENFLTLFAPDFYGELGGYPYWGRWYLWEACLFIGVIGLALAAYGLARARPAGKAALIGVMLAAALIALGNNTPLFDLLYQWLPYFDRFRGAGKFIVISALVLSLFAGYGMDLVLRERAVPRAALWTAAAAAGLLALGALAVSFADWTAVMNAVLGKGESFIDPRSLGAGFAEAARRGSAGSMVAAALTLGAAAVVATLVRSRPRAAVLLTVLAVAEVFWYARSHRTTFEGEHPLIAPLQQILATDLGDYRILNPTFPNLAMSMRAYDVWGYDPGVPRRYAELVTWLEGGDPARATQYVAFQRYDRLFALLRMKYVIDVGQGTPRVVPAPVPPLKHLELIGHYDVQSERGAALRAMTQASFDPRHEVILEQEPNPKPAAEVQGNARIVRQGTDFMEIEAELARPAILLITDAWTPAWRASALPGSSQASYELLPADYALRAVALERGKHRLRVAYAPPAYAIGAAVSALAWLAWLAAWWWLWRARRSRREASP
jgi:hypothetical protein